MFQGVDLETAAGVIFVLGLFAHLSKRNTINWIINSVLIIYLASSFADQFFLRYLIAGFVTLVLMFTLEKYPSRDSF